MTERITIICPCGATLAREPGDDRSELECPSCRRINVLPAPNGSDDGPREETVNLGDTGGKTTAIQAPPASEISEGTLVGPYKVTGVVGEGGMGRVYTAVDQNLQRQVALKILSGGLRGREDFVARFRREARAVARLNHPNIVQIYFTGTYRDTPYYAMELVKGQNLDVVLKKEGMLDPDRAVRLLIQAARGLAAAAAEGVIHRDVKPSNMVLDESGVLKITDFGLAKTVSSQSDLTLTGTIVGTPFYMSPEQGEGYSVDHRADIYSLGASFYHLLAGAPPFEAESPVSIILKHINEQLPPPEKRNPKVKAPLSAVIRRMMAKNPDERYASYDELIADLESMRRGEAPGALGWKERPPPRGRGFFRRHGGKMTSYVIEDRTAAAVPQEIRLVRTGMFRRLLAWAFDYAVLSVFLNIQIGFFDSSGWNAAFLALTFIYFLFADAYGGITLGKVFFRCRVARGDGEDLGLLRSIPRTVLFFASIFGLGAISTNCAFYRALAGALAGESVESYAVTTIVRICAIWLFLDVGYLFVGRERRAVHDTFSGAFYFTQLKAPKKEKEKKKKKKDKKAAAQAEAEAKERAEGDERGEQAGSEAARERTAAGRRHVTPKDPLLAAVLSMVFPGLGQFYNGDIFKGILVLLTCFLILPYFYGIYHAFRKARQINREIGWPV
jgi:hypothetical protein